jgi:hypothetical protein
MRVLKFIQNTTQETGSPYKSIRLKLKAQDRKDNFFLEKLFYERS